MEDRCVTLGGRMTKREAGIVERVAKKQGLTVSNYVRAAALSTCVLDGDKEAILYLSELLLKDLARRGGALLRSPGERVPA